MNEKTGIVEMKDNPLARTIFVIDTGGKVRYIQYVKEIASEPDYDEGLESIKKLI